MTGEDFRKIYEQQKNEGEEYQDFIADALRKGKPCIIVSPYCSKKYQYSQGESASGIEIKFDKLFHKTGNLYIEVKEKSSPDIEEWTPSGIMRTDNSWLYLIGDYHNAFLFHKKQLQKIYLSKELWARRGIRETENEYHTSVGFLYPADKAEECGSVLYRFSFGPASET